MNPKLLTFPSLTPAEQLPPLCAFGGGALGMLLLAGCGRLNGLTVLWPQKHLALICLARIILPAVCAILCGRMTVGVVVVPALCAAYGAMLSGEAAVAAMEQGAFLRYCALFGLPDVCAAILLLGVSVPAFARAKKRFRSRHADVPQSLSFKGGESHVCASERI